VIICITLSSDANFTLQFNKLCSIQNGKYLKWILQIQEYEFNSYYPKRLTKQQLTFVSQETNNNN